MYQFNPFPRLAQCNLKASPSVSRREARPSPVWIQQKPDTSYLSVSGVSGNTPASCSREGARREGGRDTVKQENQTKFGTFMILLRFKFGSWPRRLRR